VLLALLFIWTHDLAARQYNLQQVMNVTQAHEIRKLSFCVDHAISPCDQAHLISWNDAHRDMQFTPVANADSELHNMPVRHTWLFY